MANKKKDMMTLNTANLVDPEYRDFVETAYRRSYDKFNALQEEEGIWDRCLAAITMEELRDAIKTAKTGTAGGPSGLTYDILKDVGEEHLEPLLTMLRRCMADGTVPPEMNRTKLRPIPKTDKGLSDLSKTRPIALMEVTLKLYEKILFKRIGMVLRTNRMLRDDQYGSLPGRTVADPIRALAECVEDAMVTGKELHVFSADLSRAFDSIEYWSQAMSWRALGMPRSLVATLLDMDEGGSTEVVLGQGRTTSTVLGQEGWFKSGRGVRQGSIGGPVKWVVFMNFWLELVHARHEGEGYSMSHAQEGEELLGQMFVDDSTWLTGSTQAMTRVIASCQTFVEFHTLSFNRTKCEYMAVNQRTADSAAPQTPNWPDGTPVVAKMRKPTDWSQWNAERSNLEEQIDHTEDAALYSEGRRVERQPTEDEYATVKGKFRAVQNSEGTPQYSIARADAAHTVERLLEAIYKITHEEATSEAAEILEQWEGDREQLKPYEGAGEGETMRYLGVHFQPKAGWGAQRRILEAKFRDLTESILSSSPNREQAIYCVNAVINATLKFPLQVAGIPMSTLERWDTANRAIIRKAGKLPKLPPWMFHAPKDQGGLGLESLAEAVGRTQTGHQMRLLNSGSVPGRIVRAANARNEKRPDPVWSIQARTEAYLRSQGMRIEAASGRDFFGDTVSSYITEEEQEDLDKERAHTAPRGAPGKTWWAYGDGATYLEEQRAGWGVCISASPMCGGRYDRQAEGRLHGDQNNSAAEAMAILQAMLLIHPSHHLVMHTDNQGCVDKAQRIEGADVSLWDHRPIWNRIKALTRYREICGATTTIHWIHSHVDDPARRATPKAAHLCVCKAERAQDCDPYHWAHVGNEEADALAKSGATKPRAEGWRERARGSPAFIIRAANEVAQGPCTDWIKKHRKPHYPPHGAWEEACRHSNPMLRKATIKTLDAKGGVSWRFWSRLVAGVLPTMGRLATITNNAGPRSQYPRVYQDALGPHGRCINQGCEHQKETTRHAIADCGVAAQTWARLSETIDSEWGMEESAPTSAAWQQADWISAPPPGWDAAWTTWGLVPDVRVSPDVSNGRAAALKAAAARALGTSQGIWEKRVERLKEWEEERPDLRQRKKEAARKQWRPEGPPAPRRKRARPPASRAEERTMEAEEERARRRRRVEEEAMAEAQRIIARVTARAIANSTLIPTPLQRETLESGKRAGAMKRHAGYINDPTTKNKAAAGTPPMRRNDGDATTMESTMAADNSGELPFVWAPPIGARVKAWWARAGGSSKLNNQRGEWHEGRVVAAQWGDTGAPTVDVLYLDRSVHEHTSLHLGSLIRPAVEHPKPRKGGPPRDTLLPPYAENWIGQGARIEVKRGALWYRGVVMGRDGGSVVVKYPTTAKSRKNRRKGKAPLTRKGRGETLAHDDLATRGCRIVTMRRWEDGAPCPHEGWEPACGCEDCQTTRWPRMFARATWSSDTSLALMQLDPGERLSWVGMGLFFAVWKMAATTRPRGRGGEDGTGSPPPALASRGAEVGRGTGQSVRSLLAARGRTQGRTQGDGHCMYRALADQSGGRARDWRHLRVMVAAWIRQHWILLADDMQARGITRGDLLHQVEAYGEKVGRAHYGDEASLYAAAWVLHRRIVVVNAESATEVVVLPDAGTDSAGEVVVVYDGKQHYDTTRRAGPRREARGLADEAGAPREPDTEHARNVRPRVEMDAPGFEEACDALEAAMDEVEEQRGALRGEPRHATGTATADPRGDEGGKRKRPDPPGEEAADGERAWKRTRAGDPGRGAAGVRPVKSKNPETDRTHAVGNKRATDKMPCETSTEILTPSEESSTPSAPPPQTAWCTCAAGCHNPLATPQEREWELCMDCTHHACWGCGGGCDADNCGYPQAQAETPEEGPAPAAPPEEPEHWCGCAAGPPCNNWLETPLEREWGMCSDCANYACGHDGGSDADNSAPPQVSPPAARANRDERRAPEGSPEPRADRNKAADPKAPTQEKRNRASPHRLNKTGLHIGIVNPIGKPPEDQAPLGPGELQEDQAPPAPRGGQLRTRGQGEAANSRNVRARLHEEGFRQACDRLEAHRDSMRTARPRARPETPGGDAAGEGGGRKGEGRKSRKTREETGGPPWGPRSAGTEGPRKDSGPHSFAKEKKGVG